MVNIGILNFNYGNLDSIIQSLNKISIELKIVIVKDEKDFLKIDKLIIPGQGNMKNCINYLNKNNLIDKIKEFFNKKPILGICLGKQIFFNKSEEENSDCLRLIEGDIKKFKFYKKNEFNLKIPHLGWNRVTFLKKHELFKGLKNFKSFYFSHSFYLVPKNLDNVYGVTNYFTNFSSIFIKNNIFLTQFHPEKSKIWGLKLIYNFCNWGI